MPNTLNEIPSKEDVELMDKLLVIDHNTEQSHNYAKFSKENDLDLTECNRISDLVGTWGVHFGLYTLTKDGHSILTWKSGKFIQSGGFTSKLNQLRATQEKEEERQVKQDNKLDLDIEVSERAIKFYKNRYWWLFGFTILGGLVGWFLRQPITQLNTELPKEELQQQVLETPKEHILTPVENDTSNYK